jgi:ferrous iron transport protein B
VLHPVAGPLIFLAVVLFVFQSIFSGAKPVMDGMSWLITGLGHFVQGALPDVMLRSFLVDGVISGVGAVIVFLPQILVLFFFVALLEHTGYMARAAMVMDRLMSSVGLQGKSFLPLVSSFACAVPGIMATRTIENRRDRIATLFIAPFMTCSARLPVYALLIGAFVPDRFFFHGLLGWKALTLLGLYVVGFAAAMLTAALLKSTILKSDRMPFVMEVPPYRAPSMKTILLLMWDRSRMFLRRAGTIILGVNLILWFLVSFPLPQAKASIRDSYAGKVGVFIEPAIQPLGFDWKIGVGLLSAQAAREVIVSTLATIYRVEEDDHSQGLVSVLQKEMTPLVALSLMMFFAFSLQCTSTLAVIRRETGGWRWPIVMFLYMNTLGYLSSLVIFQGGKALGLG